MTRPFRFDRTFAFEVPPERLWAALTETARFPEWWPWLRRFDSDGLVEGSAARCTVRAPIPYALHFTVHVERVEPGRAVETAVTGDLTGPARLEVAGDQAASTARLLWEVEVRDPLLRTASRFARPLMEWGHDWVVTTGLRQFRRRALGL